MVTPEPPGPLNGLLVADFSRVLAGPVATMLLGDLGADVIKVERPGAGDDTRAWGPPWHDGESTYFLGLNRNKRSVALDLADQGERALARELILRSDVMVESFRTGLMGSWGLDGDALRAEGNPGLVSCSVTAFGSGEAAAGLPGYDLLLQAMGGLMWITGPEDGPPTKVGAAVVDLVCGLLAAAAIQAALHERASTGRGRHVEVSLLDSALTSLLNQGSAAVLGGVEPRRRGNRHPSIAPYETFGTADRPIAVAAGNDRLFGRLCAVVGLASDDSRFATNAGRVTHRDALVELLERRLATRGADEWIAELRAAGVPAGPINDVGQAWALARDLGLEPTDPDGLPRPPLRLDGERPPVRRPPPRLDEHGDEIRTWLREGVRSAHATPPSGAEGAGG
jgi:crotonobetainyl-CoA:carnitine CoA-transferase CaiB-like acyl-CoA transferase